MSPSRKNILVTLIGSITSIVVAWITALGIAQSTTNKTIKTSDSEISSLAEQIENLRAEVAAAKTTLSEAIHPCPEAVSRENFNALRFFEDHHRDEGPSSRELLNISGRGCLVTGALLGYFFQNEHDGMNYTVQIEIDGFPFHYPLIKNSRAYAQDSAGDNTGVLSLPPLRFSRSLRITYYHPVDKPSRAVTAYAVVLMN